jgi:tripartite ATP-independent transporter DctM subunit
MIEQLGPGWVAIIMLGVLLIGLMLGYPIGFVIAAISLFMGLGVWGLKVGDVLYVRIYDFFTSYILLAVPLFVFMGVMLERSGVGVRLFHALYLWFGGFRGGLALITEMMGIALAATVGIITASVTMLTLFALPPMMRRGYDKALATGAVVSGGILGILIPPSIMLVVYGPMAGLSVGKLFFAAFIPGFILGCAYIVYITIRCWLQPHLAPAVAVEDRQASFLLKTKALALSALPLILLIMSVLGVIYFGIAPPTEAAGVGCLAATILVVIYGKFTWTVLKDVTLITLRTAGFVYLIGIAAASFAAVFMGTGADDSVRSLILGVPGGRWGSFAMVMLIFFILGFFIEWIGIVFIVVPIITPVAAALQFDPIWFAIMVCVNLQMAFMTPPMSQGIYVCMGACPPELGIHMSHIVKGIIPHILIVMVVLALLVFIPELVTWLPNHMIR